MSFRLAALGALALILPVAGCESDLYGPPIDDSVAPPANLRYEVEPGAAQGSLSGVILRWSDDGNPDVAAWRVYSRSATAGPWDFRAETTSPSFYDRGIVALQYYVTAVTLSGFESAGSNVVTVDQRLTLERPASLSSVSLNQAIALLWTDNAYTSAPEGFRNYRVYSSAYDLDANQCVGSWSLEGTTVAPEFRVGAIANGVPLCFAVSAVSIEGFESLWTAPRADTPRDDARNVALTARQFADATAGFRFWRDQNGDGLVQSGELGRILSGLSPEADLVLEQDALGRLFLTPVRTGSRIQQVGTEPIADLTSIDVAPAGGYARTALEARVGFGYVVEMDGGDGFARYGALRVSHVGRDLIVFDWSFQRDPGNPELSIGR